jgi:hypothetical protein
MTRAAVSAREKIKALHSEVIVPVMDDPHPRESQTNFFGDTSLKQRNGEMGNFYELYSAIVFGGRLNNREYISNGGGRVYDLRLVKADVVDIPRKSVREIKGNGFVHQLNLLDGQMNRYSKYVQLKPELIPTIEIYRHGFEGIRSFNGTREELFSSLSRNTLYGLRLPLSVVLTIWNLPDRKGFGKYAAHYQKVSTPDKPQIVSSSLFSGLEKTPSEQHVQDLDSRVRKGVKPYESCTRVKNSTLLELLENPQAFISLIGLDLNHFNIKRLLSPPDISVEGNPVVQFPIVDITERSFF